MLSGLSERIFYSSKVTKIRHRCRNSITKWYTCIKLMQCCTIYYILNKIRHSTLINFILRNMGGYFFVFILQVPQRGTIYFRLFSSLNHRAFQNGNQSKNALTVLIAIGLWVDHAWEEQQNWKWQIAIFEQISFHLTKVTHRLLWSL